ncbi:E3 ubiquitin- ligase RHA2B-like [Olea europaea subsp. europaea]|uniref:E3 ubiquitin- ligase RHA2B-like n=1 Tax=Olea europaea subsp. europaea TaxID=158383 RepID=A0A8S0U976_OLEEU|nr:E3 ubiquitin- ligase RHA2B-like [Olea europaea subsp. europaea]
MQIPSALYVLPPLAIFILTIRNVFQFLHRSIMFKTICQIASQLKWAWDFLLHQSFFQQYSGVNMLQNLDEFSETRIGPQNMTDSMDPVECSICLCNIDEEDEVRELINCKHVFHRVCLDRWVGYGHWTCPLCRNYLKIPRIAAEVYEQEILVFDFCSARSSNSCTWWLR